MASQIIFLDPHVRDYQTLLGGISPDVDIVVLDGNGDGVAQMAAYLEGRSGIAAIHVISHGDEGVLYLGTTKLDAGSLNGYTTELAKIGSSLDEGGDILLYGCNVAAGEVGIIFIQNLSRLTGADIAASTNTSGATTSGGDWQSEFNTGTIEASIAISPEAQGKYGTVLLNHAPTITPAGVLDTGFGGDGIVTGSFGLSTSEAYDLELQADGKIVVGGAAWDYYGNESLGLVRYNPDGTLDATFAGDGSFTTNNFGGRVSYGEVRALAIQTDGKIVAVGTFRNGADFDFALVRLNTDGSLDATFSDDGKVTTPFFPDYRNTHAYANGIALQSNGKIVVAGMVYAGTNLSDFALARYNADGSLDATFDGDGILNTDIYSLKGADSASDVVVQSDGKIILAGYHSFNGDEDFALVRYNVDGSLDATFGFGGQVTTQFIPGEDDHANAIVLQANGKIVVAGDTLIDGDASFALVRYNADGSLDSTFGYGGGLTLDFISGGGHARDLVLQPDGKIVVTGDTLIGGNTHLALARFNAGGSVDMTFGLGGYLTTDISGSGRTVVLQPDGGILLGGAGITLARYKGGSVLDQATTIGTPYTLTVPSNTFNDSDGDPLTYSAEMADGSNLPAWLSFDPLTRTFRGTPTNGDVGSIDIEVTGTDPGGLSASDTFTLTVTSDLQPVAETPGPLLVTAANLAARAYSDAHYGIRALSVDAAVQTWSPVALSDLNFAPPAGSVLTVDDHVTRFDNAQASASIGLTLIDGKRTLGVTFEGTNFSLIDTDPIQRLDLWDDLIFIDRHYTLLNDFLGSVAAYADDPNNAIDQVLVVGHSLGGAMAQRFMSKYGMTDSRYVGVTFGSPGNAAHNDVPANRLVNVVHSDDLVPMLGQHGLDLSTSYGELGDLLLDVVQPFIMNIQAYTDAIEMILDGRIDHDKSAAIASYLNMSQEQVESDLTFAMSRQDYSVVGSTINIQIEEPGLIDWTSVKNEHALFYSEYTDFTVSYRDSIIALTGAFGGINTFSNLNILYGTNVDDSLETSDHFDFILGGEGNDTVEAGPGNDMLVGGAGNDAIDGGAGTDTAVVRGLVSQYTLQTQGASHVLSGPDGTDTLDSIEYLRFGEDIGEDWAITNVTLGDVGNGSADRLTEQITDLYVAYFNRAPDSGGLAYWFKTIYTGEYSLRTIAERFTFEQEYLQAYPSSLANWNFVEQIYLNLFDRNPDAGGWDWWTNELDSGHRQRSGFILDVIEGAYAPTSGPEDRTLIDNKHEASLYYSGLLSLQPEEGFDSTIATVLNRITGEANTVAAAERVIDYAFENTATLAQIVGNATLFDSLWAG